MPAAWSRGECRRAGAAEPTRTNIRELKGQVLAQRRNVAAFAVVQEPEAGLGVRRCGEEALDLARWFRFAVVGELEGTVVDRHARGRAEVAVRGECLLRR